MRNEKGPQKMENKDSKLAQDFDPVETDPLRGKILIYGQPGVGKTTMASQMDNPYFLRCDKRQKWIKTWGKDVNSWADFREQVQALLGEDHDFKTVVVDGIGNLWQFGVNEVCHDNGWEHINDSGHGKGYDYAKTKMVNAFNALASSGLGIVMICHEAVKETEYAGVVREMIKPDMIPTCWKIVNGMTDMIGRMYIKGVMVDGVFTERRCISFTPSTQYIAKDCTKYLKGSGEIIVEPEEQCWAKIAAFFKEKAND
ncbi:MAG: ATP-binding protein [Pseudomonadota bacterium]